MPERNEAQNRAVVTINNVALTPIEVDGVRVVTLGMIDEVHGRPSGTARRNFNTNRERMCEGKHFREINQPDEIRTLGFQRPQGGVPEKVTLITERGYLMLVKSFTDDLAWQVQDMLVESYFSKPVAQAVPMLPQSLPEALRLAADLAEQVQAEKERAAALEAQTVADAPKVAFAEQVEAAPDALTMGMVAKILGTGRTRLSEKLKQMGWLTRWGEPYQAKIEAGFLAVKITKWEHPTDGLRQRSTPLVTGKGMARLNVILADWLAIQNPKKGGA